MLGCESDFVGINKLSRSVTAEKPVMCDVICGRLVNGASADTTEVDTSSVIVF